MTFKKKQPDDGSNTDVVTFSDANIDVNIRDIDTVVIDEEAERLSFIKELTVLFREDVLDKYDLKLLRILRKDHLGLS